MTLLAPTFLFRFAVPCRRCQPLWSDGEMELPESHRIPSFGELEGRPVFADLRIGWNVGGLALSIRVVGKKQPAWCRTSRLEDSDGLALWLDTRNAGNIHRASRFCHEFRLLPQGGGPRQEQPVARGVEIARARENPKPIDSQMIRIRSEKRIDGYLMRVVIPAEALTGFDPEEQRQLGFSYAVMDRELGWQTLTVGSEFPFTSDPSLWGVLDLLE